MKRYIAFSLMLLLAAIFSVAQKPKEPARNEAPKYLTPPTYTDVKYGPAARNVMDVWLAKSDKPTPVLVSIHGGGFRGGNKSVASSLLEDCLKSGISVVAITYRLSNEAKAPAQFMDGARAIQFIRYKAMEWNMDGSRIAATGGSAGAGISLWLGFHDDMADPKNADPVLRQSTRLTVMAVFNGQSSYDPRVLRKLFPDTDVYKENALAALFEVDLNNLDQLPADKYKLFEECSALPHLTKDDPPVLLVYDAPMEAKFGIHHPRFGTYLKEKMDALGIECQVIPGIKRAEQERLIFEFVKKRLGVQ